MILSKEELELRLNSSNNLINIMTGDRKNPTIKVIKWQGSGATGRPLGAKGLSEDERIAAGVLSRTVGNEIASEVFGITEQHASNISNGNASMAAYKSKVDESLDNVKKTVEERAAERLLASLGFLTDDKLSMCDAKDLSSVVTNMSRTMANMRPKEQQGDGRKVSVVIHANKQMKEEHFEIIEVSA